MPVPNSGEKYKPPVQRRDRMQVGDSRGKASQFWSRDSVNGNVKTCNISFWVEISSSFWEKPKVLILCYGEEMFCSFQSKWDGFFSALSFLEQHLSSATLHSQILLACAHLLLAACLSFACMISFFLLSLIVSDYRLLACFLIAWCIWLSDCMMSVWDGRGFDQP